jgi:excisionase family DNA binding protein
MPTRLRVVNLWGPERLGSAVATIPKALHMDGERAGVGWILVADTADNFIIPLMPKAMSPAEVRAIVRRVRSVMRDVPPASRRRILAAMSREVRGVGKLLRSLLEQASVGAGTACVRNLSDLAKSHGRPLTHLIAIGLDGDRATFTIDLHRGSAREARDRLVGAERDAAMTPNEAARSLGISRTHLRHLMDNGIIAFSKIGTHHRIAPSEVARMKAEWDRRSRAMAEAAAASADIDT